MMLLELTWLIFLFNLITFGNGPTMIPLLQQSLVNERGVLTLDQLLYAFAIARVTPGPANVYVTSIGYMLFGIGGAVATTLAITFPGYLMLPLLRGYDHLKNSKVIKNFTRGLTTTSVGLIFATTVSIADKTLVNLLAWIIFGFTFVLSYFLKWNQIVCLLVASAAGFILNFWLK